MKKNNGITLIALVITIIVLLILAGVALSLVAGNEGILGKTEKAVSETNIATAKEQAELLIAELTADYYEKRYVYRTENSELVEYIEIQIDEGKITSNGDYFVTLNTDGKVTVYTGDSAIAQKQIIMGTLESDGKIVWSEINDSVVATPSQYLAYTVSNGNATITGIKDEYKNIESIIIPERITDDDGEYTVTRINGLSGGKNIKSIEVSSNVTYIMPLVFNICENLNSIKVNENNTTYSSSEDGVLYDKNKTNLIRYPNGKSGSEFIVPDGVATIQAYAFTNCTNLTKVTIPSSVTSVVALSFSSNKSLTDITVSEENSAYSSEAGVLYDYDATKLIKYPDAKNGGEFTILDTVTTIGEYAFMNCKNITNIIITDHVTSIGNTSFNNCSNLANITVSEGNGAYSSEDGVLYDKNKTKLVKYPSAKSGDVTFLDTVSTIWVYALENCASLESITLSDNVTKLESASIYNCKNLSSITIPSSLTSIGGMSFFGCENLTTIKIDSATIASGLTSYSYLIKWATTIYIKSGLTVDSNITDNFTEVTSDKEGYVMYTKNI